MLPKRTLNRLARRLSERRADEFGVRATVFPHGGRSFEVRYLPGSVTTRDVLEDGGMVRLEFSTGRIIKGDMPRNTELEPGWCVEVHSHNEDQKDGEVLSTGARKLQIDEVSEHPLDPEIRIRLVERR